MVSSFSRTSCYSQLYGLATFHFEEDYNNRNCGLVLLFLFAGYIKYTLPRILEAHYKQQITHAYQESFSPLDSYFNQMGVVFQPVDASSCPYGPYDVYNQCSKSRSSNDIVFGSKSEAAWIKAGQRLDAYLSAHNWYYGSENGAKASTFAGVFSHTGTYQVIVEYSKEMNGVTCTVSADYFSSTRPGAGVMERCSKYSEPNLLDRLVMHTYF